jgi:hypothetical protein
VLPDHQKTPATATLSRQNQMAASQIDDETSVIHDTSHTPLAPDAQHISATSIVKQQNPKTMMSSSLLWRFYLGENSQASSSVKSASTSRRLTKISTI